MLNPHSSLRRLLDAPIRPGQVQWMGLRPARHAPMQVVDAVELDPAQGLIADHYSGGSGTRQVSLIGRENLAAIASFLGRNAIDPERLRRNIVVAGVNLFALKERRFRLGGAVLETSGECHPCSRLEALLGPGGYNAVRGQGGIVARVVTGGTVRLGDALARMDPS